MILLEWNRGLATAGTAGEKELFDGLEQLLGVPNPNYVFSVMSAGLGAIAGARGGQSLYPFWRAGHKQ
jgi:hypothetical protein